ncbi:M20 family metallopeptidase [Microbacterium sp. KR10-403]|uniref:M20 metallopeptidase family protein n=1 Tax=Microbacterium sp. KR10-403 TaxID=3158581 RepID=UPI0032E4E0ED
MDFATEAAALLPNLQDLRRALHRNPEVGLDLPETQQRVLAALDGLGLELTLGQRTTSIVGVLRGGRPGPTVLLRGDMDALPIEEQTELEFASTNGAMHACGHDLHTAGLVGAARLLAAHRDELPGTVIFMFQPGEEGCNGASVMIDEGVLDAAGERPVAAYGIHVGPGEFGVFATRSGTIAAGANALTVKVHGKGGHGSMPWSATDPVPALAEIVTGLHAMTTRSVNVFDPVVLSVTRLGASPAVNIIPSEAWLQATIRTLSRASLDLMIERTRTVAEGIAAAHGCTAEVDFDVQYPVTVNDDAEAAWTIDTVRSALGAERMIEVPEPGMGSEDFSFVLEKVPGAFIMLQCSPPGTDPATAAFNHSPTVLFDDAVLGDQAAVLATLAWERLAAR